MYIRISVHMCLRISISILVGPSVCRSVCLSVYLSTDTSMYPTSLHVALFSTFSTSPSVDLCRSGCCTYLGRWGSGFFRAWVACSLNVCVGGLWAFRCKPNIPDSQGRGSKNLGFNVVLVTGKNRRGQTRHSARPRACEGAPLSLRRA